MTRKVPALTILVLLASVWAIGAAPADPPAPAPPPAEGTVPAEALEVTPPLPKVQAPKEKAPPGDAELHRRLRGLIRRGGTAVSINGKLRFIHGPGHYVPASILKLATAQAALFHLGPDFHFATEVYLDADNVLYIRGLGDPFLVSEEWRRMGQALEQLGVFGLQLKKLVLDTSAFDPNLVVDGVEYTLNPYDARPGALVTNFNTINLMVLKDRTVQSAEEQTPLTPLGIELAKRLRLRPGEQRINLSKNPANGPRYSGEVALAVFEELGAHIPGGFRFGKVPPGLQPVLVHHSEQPLTEVIQGMLEFSNNFVANQILLQMALKVDGPPARLKNGVAVLRKFLIEQMGLAPDSFQLVEGSGISRGNRMDLQAMLKITDAFYPWRALLRLHKGADRIITAKTGTLKGVYSLAGFLPAPEGERRAFVVMENQQRFTRELVLNQLLIRFADPPYDTEYGP
jgi:D-alanyl-D-alanine carboxypeptidase/D-alanyl-D-alanine-endopeptidase (penicillin-binding protein 4)